MVFVRVKGTVDPKKIPALNLKEIYPPSSGFEISITTHPKISHSRDERLLVLYPEIYKKSVAGIDKYLNYSKTQKGTFDSLLVKHSGGADRKKLLQNAEKKLIEIRQSFDKEGKDEDVYGLFEQIGMPSEEEIKAIFRYLRTQSRQLKLYLKAAAQMKVKSPYQELTWGAERQKRL